MKEPCYLTKRTLFDHELIGEYLRNGGELIATNEYDYRNFIPAYFLKYRPRSGVNVG